MAIGTIRCFAIDVEDLEVGASFWSELTGIPRISSPWPDRFAYLGYEDETTWRHDLLLHRVTSPKRSDPDEIDVARRIDPAANRAHVDIGVEDVDVAIAQIEQIGGRLKYEPTLYPVPHAYDGARPVIDWAVMQDPFGNEFCLVRVLAPAERAALALAAEEGPASDDHWRRVAADVRSDGGKRRARPTPRR